MCLVLILGSSGAIAGYWASSDGWIGYAIVVPFWFIGTAGLCIGVPQAKQPKHWGVPLVPWLPSLSIAINIFLLGSIDKDSFIRFGIWSTFLLVYYFLFGLHASYDTAKEFEAKNKSASVMEEGVAPSAPALSSSEM